MKEMMKKEYEDVLENKGVDDIKRNVDLDIMKKKEKEWGWKKGKMKKGEFMIEMGLVDREGRIGEGKEEDFKEKIRKDVERMEEKDKMGKLLKVIELSEEKKSILNFE